MNHLYAEFSRLYLMAKGIIERMTMHRADSQHDRNGIPRVSSGRNSLCALRSLSTERDVDLARWQESNDDTARIARLEFACGGRVKIDSQGLKRGDPRAVRNNASYSRD